MKKSREELKGKFVTGAKPQEEDYHNALDSYVHKDELAEAVEAMDLKGEPGEDAHQPMRGWYESAEAIPTEGAQEGDYAYVKGAGSTVASVYAWNGTAFADTGKEVDVSGAGSFGDGTPVYAVRIVDGLGGGGPKDVLSANQGRLLNNKVSALALRQLSAAVEEECVGMLDGFDDISGYIDSGTLKFADNANAAYKVFPVDNVAVVKVTANSSANTYVYQLTEAWAGHAAGSPAPLAAFHTYPISLTPGEEVEFPVVSDARHLYIYVRNTSGDDTTPASLKLTGRNAVAERSTLISLSPANKPYVRPTNTSSTSTSNKNQWHNTASHARAVNTGSAGSLLRVTANESNNAYVAVLAVTTVVVNHRAIFAAAYGGDGGWSGSTNLNRGGTVAVPAGSTIDIYVPDDTAAVMFYYGAADTDTHAPARVERIRYSVVSIDDKIADGLGQAIDTALPDTPSDTRVPSTRLLAASLDTLRGLIPDSELTQIFTPVAIPSDLSASRYNSYIGFSDQGTNPKKWIITNNYCSWLMPVSPGDTYRVTAAAERRTGIAFLTSSTKGTSASTPAWAAGNNQVTAIPAGETRLFTAPDDAVVMYIYMGPKEGGGVPAAIGRLVTAQQAVDGINTRIDNIADELNQGTGILDLYPDSEMLPRFLQLQGNEYKYDDDTQKAVNDCVVFAQVSDCHGGSNTSGSTTNKNSKANWQRFVTFAKHWADKGCLDDVIDTGDIVANKFANLLDEWRADDDNFTARIKVCIGNHDIASASSSGAEASETNPQINLPAYNKFIAPCVGSWLDEGVVLPPDHDTQGKCYYYKDYTKTAGNGRTMKLRALFLDAMGWGKDTNTTAPADAQKTWLEAVLADALTGGFMVCIFMHFAPQEVTRIPCSFSSASTNKLNAPSTYNHLVHQVASVVYDFQLQGGRFVGYFVGHVHRTFVGTLSGSVTSGGDTVNLSDAPFQQLVFATDNAMMGLSGTSHMQDGVRKSGTPSHDSFWVVAVNTSGNVKLLKVGFNTDKYGRRRDMLMVRTASYPAFDPTVTTYQPGTVLYKNGTLWQLVNPVVADGRTDWAASDKIPYSRIVE